MMEWSCCKDGVCKNCGVPNGKCTCGWHPAGEDMYSEPKT